MKNKSKIVKTIKLIQLIEKLYEKFFEIIIKQFICQGEIKLNVWVQKVYNKYRFLAASKAKKIKD